MPAYASHSIDYAIQQLGGRIHEERRRQGLTLQELAARSSISISRLSQIENGHRVLDAVQADAIAEAFGMSLEAFLPADVTIPYVLSRDSEVRSAPITDPSVESALLQEGEQSWPLAGFFTEGDSEDGRAQVSGRELGALRKSRGWTTEQVARMGGLKDRQIEQIEAGTRRLPLDVMIRLARAFGKPLREFLRDTRNAGPHYFVQRSSEIPALAARQRRMPTDRAHAPTPNVFYPLASGFATRHMYPYLIRVRNVDTETLARHEHHGEEFMYVLEGQLEVTTYAEEKKVTEILRPGDSCYIDASVPHFVRGVTRSPYSQISAEVLDVFWCPLGETYLFAD